MLIDPKTAGEQRLVEETHLANSRPVGFFSSSPRIQGHREKGDGTCVHRRLPRPMSRLLKNTVAAVILGVKLADGPPKVGGGLI